MLCTFIGPPVQDARRPWLGLVPSTIDPSRHYLVRLDSGHGRSIIGAGAFSFTYEARP